MKIRPYYPTFSEASRFPVKPFLLKSSQPPSFPHIDPTGETWQRPQPISTLLPLSPATFDSIMYSLCLRNTHVGSKRVVTTPLLPSALGFCLSSVHMSGKSPSQVIFTASSFSVRSIFTHVISPETPITLRDI